MVKQLCLFWVHELFITCHLCLCYSQLFFRAGDCPCVSLLEFLVWNSQLFKCRFSSFMSSYLFTCLLLVSSVNVRITDLQFTVLGPPWECLALKRLLHCGVSCFKTSCVLEGWEHCLVHRYSFLSVIHYEFNSIIHAADIYCALNSMSDAVSDSKIIGLNWMEILVFLPTPEANKLPFMTSWNPTSSNDKDNKQISKIPSIAEIDKYYREKEREKWLVGPRWQSLQMLTEKWGKCPNLAEANKARLFYIANYCTEFFLPISCDITFCDILTNKLYVPPWFEEQDRKNTLIPFIS